MKQVSDTFKNANLFHSIVLKEAERLAIDNFLKEMSESILLLYQGCHSTTNKLVVAVSIKYVEFLKTKIKSTSNEGRKYLYSFILLSHDYQ